jgi:CSLREA domain-containing protein
MLRILTTSLGFYPQSIRFRALFTTLTFLLCGLMTLQTQAAPGGDLDPSFGNGGKIVTPVGNSAEGTIAIQADGKIVAVGIAGGNSDDVRPVLIRYKVRAELSFIVTRIDDRNNGACVPGDCSLREAVNAANASPSDDTINFASALTGITLTNQILINNAGSLAINGPGANTLTIDGGIGTNRIFLMDNAAVTISGMTLTGGNGQSDALYSGSGGAIYTNGGSLTLDGVHLTGNTTLGAGGGFYAYSSLTIVNSTISGNTATYGGGFYNSGSLIVANSTISSNTASNGGGFVIVGDTRLRNVTITNNTAQQVGGIYQSYSFVDEDPPIPSSLDFGNTIVAGNISTNGITPEISNNPFSIITSKGGNLIGDSPGDSINTGRAIAYQPTDIRDTNPMLGALQNNGGTTPTHALLTGSPAIDKGINSLSINPFNNSILQTDQRGFARILGSVVDTGAFEFVSVKSRKRIRFF